MQILAVILQQSPASTRFDMFFLVVLDHRFRGVGVHLPKGFPFR